MSIEKKLTYLKNTKALIRKKLNRFGINVSSENTFRSYVDFLDEILNRYPKSRGQGTSITLENTIEAQFTEFDVEGNSTQETNLFDGKLSQGTLDSTGVEVDSVYRIRTTNYIEVVGGTTIPIKAQSNKEIQYLVYVFNNSKEVIATMGWNDINTSQTLQLNAKYIKLLFSYKDGSAISTSNVTNIVVGDVPNPNYEVPIYSAGDNENLFDIDSVTSVIRGQIPDENKVIYTDESTSGNFNVIPNFSALELKSTTYFISMDIKRETGSLTFGKINDGNSDWTLVKAPSLSNDYNRYIYKKTYSENTSINRMLIQFIGEGSASIKNIKIELGKASGYSPYGMGSINEKIQNKNFANNAGNGYIASDGGIAVSNVAFHNDFIPIPENETKVYYYGSNLSASMSNVYANRLFFYDENKGKVTVYSSISTPTSYTIPNGAKYVRASWLNAVENPMLVFGGAIPYVPHEEQDYSIPVQQPMRSIGDVRDKFVKKSDGKLYERHYIGEVILNGSENWNYEGGRFVLNFLISALDISGRQKVYSNYFEYLPSGSADYGIFVYKASSTNSQIYILDKDYTATAEFKAMLAEKYANGKPVYVQYLLAEPLDLPCTPEQIEALENKPSTYKDFTIIQSEDATEAYLEVAGLKED